MHFFFKNSREHRPPGALMSVKLLTEQYLEFPGLKGGCTGSYESTIVKMPY